MLLSIAYPPEIRSASQQTQGIALELKKRGHNVTVVTGYPKYNLAEGNHKTQYAKCIEEDGIKVVRLRSLPIHKVPFFLRGVGELTLPLFFALGAIRHVDNPVDVIEVYSPPLSLGLCGCILKYFFHCSVIVNIQDIFPQNALDLGLIKNSVVFKGFRLLEDLVYRLTNAITVHSEGNKDFLIIKRKQKSSKVHIVHNWIDLPDLSALNGNGYYRTSYNLEGKFIILFAGVMGPAQGLDIVVDAAEKIIDSTNIVFLMVGDGMEKARLIDRCKTKGLKNVCFRPFVSQEEYPKLVKESDVGFLSISGEYRTPVVPGKLLGYMAVGKPVVAALNKESDGHAILKDSGGGLSVLGGDADGLAQAILTIYKNRKMGSEMGEKGRIYVDTHFRLESCVDLYEEIFIEERKKRNVNFG